jgi:hypothetical protein
MDRTNLIQACQVMETAATDAQKWITKNQNIVAGAARINTDLRREVRNLRKIRRALGKNMCAGVFGPSQAGKSYLLSALARDASGKLEANFNAENLDFIAKINPEGGKESTGLVTRFTMRPCDRPAEYPVHLQLLTETDLVKIIANSYFCDCQHKADDRKEAIDRKLKELHPLAAKEKQNVTVDDMEELHEYMSAEFKSQTRIMDLEKVFWGEAVELAPKLPLAHRIELYSLFWDELPQLTSLLRKLLDALAGLNYATEIYAKIDALTPREQSIIDVAMLTPPEEGQDPVPPVSIQTPDGAKHEIPRWIITALTAELTIVMVNKPAPFFDETDLLDFPGYRSRYKFTKIAEELETHGTALASQMFLRGKVAYLFQRYCAEKELTSMLLCIGPSNQEVKDLPGVIKKWIDSTHGATPEKRALNSQDSLFFILTKADMDFEEKSGSTNLDLRWKNRLQASLLDFFGTEDTWPVEWKPNQPFNNMFLLRNPNFTWRAMMKFDANDREVGILEDRKPYVEKMRHAFVDNPDVSRHFAAPEEAWKALMTLNDGGISYIRDHLSPLCNPDIKTEQLRNLLLTATENIEQELKPFYHSDDKAEEFKKKEAFTYILMNKYFGEEANLEFSKHFGELLEALTVSSDELYDLHREAGRQYAIRREENSGKACEAKAAPAVPAGTNPFARFMGPKKTQKSAPKAAIFTVHSAFVDCIMQHWQEKMHRLANSPEEQAYFQLSPSDFKTLVTEIQTASLRTKLDEALKEKFEIIARPADMSEDSKVRKQSTYAASAINSFVSWLGLDPSKTTDAERTLDIYGETATVFPLPEPASGYPELQEESELSEKVGDFFRDWVMVLYDQMRKNLYFDGKNEFNREQNALLGTLIEQIQGAKEQCRK